MRELRIDSRQLPHARDQPLEPVHVLRQHHEEPFPVLRPIRRDQHFGGRSDRREGISELVRDIGGKRLQQPDVRVESRRQLFERMREVANLVVALDDVEPARERRPPVGERRRGMAQANERLDDRRGHEEAQQRRDDYRRDYHLEHPQPERVECLQRAERRLRHDDGARHAGTALDGHRAVQRHRALAWCPARGGTIHALQRRPHFGHDIVFRQRHALAGRLVSLADPAPRRTFHANQPRANAIQERIPAGARERQRTVHRRRRRR